jgi:hypothetical protein
MTRKQLGEATSLLTTSTSGPSGPPAMPTTSALSLLSDH